MVYKNKATIIREKINELNKELKEIQDKCKHKRATYIHMNTYDEYERRNSSAWREWSCPTCLKFWVEKLWSD